LMQDHFDYHPRSGLSGRAERPSGGYKG
jgi:hypothetical protein